MLWSPDGGLPEEVSRAPLAWPLDADARVGVAPGRAGIAELGALTRAAATARAEDVAAVLEVPVGLRS